MEIQHKDDGKKGVFFIEENGKRIAEMTYVWSGENRFIIDHTEVDPSQEGKGIAKLLVKAGVDFARANQHKILPVCPYAKKVLERTDEYKDILF